MEKRRGKGIPWRKVRAVKSADEHEDERENERSVIAVLVYINQLSPSFFFKLLSTLFLSPDHFGSIKMRFGPSPVIL